ncbi:MAG TPA: SDR family oxidoreductase [Acetobacteraceae bacterium]|nr:SDR family oxidoreductase [Acetobacteraceae bacterium]
MQIAGSVVLITGANRGIGRAFVAGFEVEGARKIYAAARDPATIQNSRVVPIRLDIMDPQQVTSAAAACSDINVLVNNAGVGTFTPFLEAPDMAAARLEMETNYFGTLAMCRAFAPVLACRGGGVLVNILSTASWMTWPWIGSYSASKRAQLALTMGVRMELRSQGTLVIGVFPDYVDTDMTAHVSAEKASPEEVVAATLAGIVGDKEEIVPDPRAARVKAVLREDPDSLEADAQRTWDEHRGFVKR